MYHQRNVQGYCEGICIQTFQNGFCSYNLFIFAPPLNVVNQISHNSSCLGKNDTKSWIYFIYFLGIRLHVLPKSNLWRDNQNLIFLLNANQEKIRPEQNTFSCDISLRTPWKVLLSTGLLPCAKSRAKTQSYAFIFQNLDLIKTVAFYFLPQKIQIIEHTLWLMYCHYF